VQVQKRRHKTVPLYRARVLASTFLFMATVRCESTGPSKPGSTLSTLRIGAGQVQIGQIAQNIALEGLVVLGEDGRPIPRVAQGWTVADDGLSIVVKLRPGVRFHDGSPVTAPIIAAALSENLPKFMGVAYEDVLAIDPLSGDQVAVRLRRPSQFVLESLEVQLPKPGEPGVGTGPFAAGVSGPSTEMRANSSYYLGRPDIDRIVISVYPDMRAAWAELLRGNIDMVYEVGANALDSLETATNVGVFSSVRWYQYAIILNPKSPALRPPAVRRALNAAIDRDLLVRDALNGHGLPSSGPVWPKHWAF
jgi:peptide/nickel transport system substrate-binding protein